MADAYKMQLALPTAEEYLVLREAYAETYPVRPLLNAIDAKDAEIERLRAALEWYATLDPPNGHKAREALRSMQPVETTPVQCKWIEVTHGQFTPGCGADRFTTTWRDPLMKFCEYCGKPLQWPADVHTDKTDRGP